MSGLSAKKQLIVHLPVDCPFPIAIEPSTGKDLPAATIQIVR
jgi:hypothetical protein